MWAELPYEHNWRAALDALSHTHRGEPSTVTIIDSEAGRRVGVLCLPFEGWTEDRPVGRGLAVTLRAKGGAYVTRFFNEPEQVLVDAAPDGSRLNVRIRTREGITTLIEMGGAD